MASAGASGLFHAVFRVLPFCNFAKLSYQRDFSSSARAPRFILDIPSRVLGAFTIGTRVVPDKNHSCSTIFPATNERRVRRLVLA